MSTQTVSKTFRITELVTYSYTCDVEVDDDDPDQEFDDQVEEQWVEEEDMDQYVVLVENRDITPE